MVLVPARIRHHRGHTGGLVAAEAGGGGLVVAAGGGFGAVDAVAPFDDVQIHLEDAALAPGGFDHQGDDRFLALAEKAAFAGEEQVLGELLADGRAAGDEAAFLQVLFDRLLNALDVEALVFDEFGVLGGDDGALQVDGYTVVGHPLVAQPGVGVLVLLARQAGLHERGGGGVVIDPPQHVGEDPQLIQQHQRDRRDDALAEPAQCGADHARRFAMTGAVSGRTPRHR